MEVTFWGAARTVTGSMHQVALSDGRRLLLDCGLFQGRRAQAREINGSFPFDASKIDAVLLSHAHIDHSGQLPSLYKHGFRGKIYATHATSDLCRPMLLDSAFIQFKDAEFVNRHLRRGELAIEPLYRPEDAEAVLGQFVSVGYGDPFRPLEGVEVEYRDAGHILGSATMVLTVQESSKSLRLGFTGDVGRADRPILRDPQPMAACEYLISESTYGGRTHQGIDATKRTLAEVISRTASRGGKVLIPAFAVGRTQEIVYRLEQLSHEGKLPRIPIVVDSPLAVNITAVYQTHPECYDAQLRHHMLEDDDPFGFDRLRYVRRVEESKALNASRVPMVIISASGMCEAGRILHHLRNAIEDERNTILIVGYCAENTLGRKLADQQREVRIFGEPFRRRAEVVVIDTLSAHADQPELLSFLSSQDPSRLRRLDLVHGEIDRQEALKKVLKKKGFRNIHIPARGESFKPALEKR